MDIKDVRIGQRLKIVKEWAKPFIGQEIIVLRFNIEGDRIEFLCQEPIVGYYNEPNSKWGFYFVSGMEPCNKLFTKDPRPPWL